MVRKVESKLAIAKKGLRDLGAIQALTEGHVNEACKEFLESVKMPISQLNAVESVREFLGRDAVSVGVEQRWVRLTVRWEQNVGWTYCSRSAP